MGSAAVFWSYAHEDDRLDGGRLTALARQLAEEYALITGDTIELFVDRDDLSWGDEWRKIIDAALSSTSFFVPVITPRYFTRPECRRELLDFYGTAKSLGLTQLIMPIRYIPVPDLQEENPDEAVAIVSRMQYVDWIELRLADPEGVAFRTAVNAMASRLASLAAEVVDAQLSQEAAVAASSPPEGEPGMAEVLAEIERLLPAWHDAVIDDQVTKAQYQATDDAYTTRLDKLNRSGAPAGAKLALLYRQAGYELPIAEKHRDNAKVYSARTIELDPLVTPAARLGREHPDLKPLLSDVRAAVEEALSVIAKSGRERGRPAGEFWLERAHLGRTVRTVGETFREAARYTGEANETVVRWGEMLGIGATPPDAFP